MQKVDLFSFGSDTYKTTGLYASLRYNAPSYMDYGSDLAHGWILPQAFSSGQI